MKKTNLFGENGILSGKRVFLLTCCAAVLLTGVTSVAASSNIKSQGVITYDNHTVDPSDDVFFDASDLTMLETEIQTATEAAVQGKNDLVDKLKEKLPSSVTDGLGDNPTYDEIADAIGNIGKGANFTADELLEGKIGYDGTNLVTGTMPNKGAFTSTGLRAGESITIPKGFHNGSGFIEAASLASQTGVTGTYINTHDTEDTSDDTEEDLVAATADNLSLGTAAWVDGQYIVGNGADNNSYYAIGRTESLVEETYFLSSSEANLFPKVNVTKEGMKVVGYGISKISLNASNVAHQSGYNMIPSITVSCDGTYLSGTCYMQSNLSGNIAFGTITVNVYYQPY